MSVIKESSSKDLVVDRFTHYLNSPLGRKVLDSLDDGESFILQTDSHALRITKKDGRAIVERVPLEESA